MATRNDGDTNGCTFQWNIENISHCWWSSWSCVIVSPTFIADSLQGTKWNLGLWLMNGEDENDISLDLLRHEDCRGPNVFEVEYQFAFLNKEGLILKEETGSHCIKKGTIAGFAKFESQERVFITDRERFIPEDTLTVQCTLQKPGENLVKSKYLYGATIYNTNRKSFDWRIEKFSTIQPEVRKKFKDDLVEFDLVFREELELVYGEEFDRKLSIDMILCDPELKYFSCNTSIIDFEGKKEYCGIIARRFPFKKGILSSTLNLSNILENKRYLLNDVLSLNFRFAFTTVEYIYCGENCMDEQKEDVGKAKIQSRAVLIDELKALYSEGIFCDIELRATTKTFPAHKAILSARSAVFRNMFSHDMKEKNSGYVNITDLEDDTVHRMLLFIYTADLDNLQLESASKLYSAADKYDIPSLKSGCSSFLKQNLSPANACDILVLVDLHNDDDLKSAVEDYILGQQKQIFCSQEWKDFMNTHIQLAASVMYKKINQELDVPIMRGFYHDGCNEGDQDLLQD